MSERVADLYADISLRGGDDFEERLANGRQSLVEMGRAADTSSEQVRRAALRQSTAYQEVRKELDKARETARKTGQASSDAADRERIAVDRLADARVRYGNESTQARRAEESLQRAHRETETAARRAERATDQLTITQRRAGQVAEEAAASMRRAGQDMEQAVPTDMAAQGEEGGGSFGGAFLGGAAGKLKGLAGKGGPIAAAVVGVATVGLAAGALLAKSISEGANRERAQDNIQAQMGIDDATAAKVGRAASESYMDAWGQTVEGNMESLRSLKDFNLLDTKASQQDMEGLIAKVETLNGVLGSETPESLRAVSGLVRSGLVGNIDEAADLIVTARQRGMDAQGDLIDSISEYSAGWKNTGLSAKFNLALIDQSLKNGVDNTDRGADALREFGRRVTEEGPKMIEALNNIGLNGQEMYDSFKKGGPDAEKAFDATFDKIRAIKDPVERNQAAMALLGDTAGDFIGVFANWDPSKAVSDFGSVEGAAARARDVMNDNAATTWEGLQRTVEEATMGIKQSMAEAFGPSLGEMAQGLLENKDELTAFFADITSAALTMAEGVAQVSVGVLHTFGFMSTGLGSTVGTMVKSIGDFADLLGGLLAKIPGMKSVGEGIQSAGQAFQGFQSAMESAGEKSHGVADTIADTVIPGIVAMRDKVNEAGDSARRNAEGIDVLSSAVSLIPDGKTIVINDNSPETIAKLNNLGLIVTTLPNGQLQVTANTEQGQAVIDNFLASTQGKAVTVSVNTIEDQKAVFWRTVEEFRRTNIQTAPNADGSIREHYADGGLPSNAVIQQARGKRGLVQWAESDAGPWEAFIPGAESKRPRAMNILSEVASRFGYQLFKAADGGIKGYGLPAGSTGGFPDWVNELGSQYGVKPSTYAGHQEGSRSEAGYAPNPQGLNRGIDWGGSTAQMQAFAEAMYARAQTDSAIEQIIWQNPETGQKIGWHGRSPDTDGSYYASDYPGHQDHVHLRVNSQIGAQAQAAAKAKGPRTIPLKKNPDGTWTSTDPAWADLIKRESGGDADIVQQVNDVNSGGNEASGLFQIAKGTWASNGGAEFAATAGEADPEKQAIVAARIFDKSGGSPWGAGLAGREDEAALRAGIKEAAAADPAAGAADGSAAGQRVFVTNWPSGLGSGGSSSSTVNVSNSSSGGSSGGAAGVTSVDAAVNALDAAKRKQADAAGAERVAQAKLTDLKKTGKASMGDLAAAEEKAAKARRAGLAAADGVTEAEKKLKDARAKKSTGTTDPDKPDLKITSPLMRGRPPMTRTFADGGLEDHQAQIARPGDYRMWAEPETGGEGYIPLSPSKRPQSLRIWAEIGRRFGVSGFSEGGFGGYSKDTRDVMAPKSLYDLASIGVGTGFMAASGIIPLAQMIGSGKIDLGNVAPTFDSSANDIPGLSGIVGDYAQQISSQLAQVVEAIRKGQNVTVTVESDSGPAAMLAQKSSI